MEIRGIHGGRVGGTTAHHKPTDVSNNPSTSPSVEGSDKADSHTRSPELLRLSELLHRIPEVREDVVARVSQKLAQGDYDNREVAERTAQTILNQR